MVIEGSLPTFWVIGFLRGAFTSCSVYKGELGKSRVAFLVFHVVLSALVAC